MHFTAIVTYPSYKGNAPWENAVVLRLKGKNYGTVKRALTETGFGIIALEAVKSSKGE